MKWDLLIHKPFPGQINMAVDWWLLNNSKNPILRFYEWNEPTVSLGYRQQFNPPGQLNLFLQEMPVVVRPTGGGYLVHADEITYSIIIPSDHPDSKLTIMEFYNQVTQCFAGVLKKLGLIDSLEPGEGSGYHENCLAEPGCHEPTLQGKKWMASAQVQHRNGLLQHGSLFWNKTRWPASVDKIQPFFLGSDSELSKEGVVDQLIDAWFGGRKRRDSSFDVDWATVESLASSFSVTDPTELPIFHRKKLV